jgi:hypothetical protein
MSVRTEADSQLDTARDDVHSALKALGKILVEQCWGHDDYKAEFRAKMVEAHGLLLQVQEKLR